MTDLATILISDTVAVVEAATQGPPGRGRAEAVFAKAGTLAPTTGVNRWVAEVATTIRAVIASVGTAPVGDDLILDVLKNGTTVFTTAGNRPTILDGENQTTSAAPDVSTMAAGDYLTVDVVQVGAPTAGADLTVQVLILQ